MKYEETMLDLTKATRPRGKIYGARGEVAHTYPLPDPMLAIVESLSRMNGLLRDIPWKRRISSILDEKGKPYLTEMP